MSILLFVLITRIRNAFGRGTGAFMALGGVVGLLIAVLYGLGFGFMFHLAETEPEEAREAGFFVMMPGLLLGILIMGLLKDFLPSYKRRPNLIPVLAPQNRTTRWMVNQTAALTNLFVVAFLAFAASFAVFGASAEGGWMWVSLFLVTALLAETLSFTIRTLMEYRVKSDVLLWIGIVITASAIPISFYMGDGNIPLALVWITLLAGFILSGIADRNSVELKAPVVVADDSLTAAQALFRMPFRNEACKRMLMLGLLFKIGMGIFLYFQVHGNENVSAVILWEFKLLYLSPVMLFTYIYGNVWGFFPELFLQSQKVRPLGTNLFILYISLLALPLFIDVAVAIFGAVLIGIPAGEVAGLIIGTGALCIAAAFWGSVFLPKKVDGMATMRKSQIHTGLSFGIVVLLVIFCIGFAFEVSRWWTVGITITVSLLALLLTIRSAEANIYTIVRKVS